MDPVAVCSPDYSFGSGTHNQFFLEPRFGVHHHAFAVGRVLEAVVGHHGAFLGEAFHVFGFTAEERFGNEQREICVLHTGLLEHAVESLLHFLPDCISVGFDYHATPDGGLFGQVGFHHQVVVPLGVVLGAFCEVFEFCCHGFVSEGELVFSGSGRYGGGNAGGRSGSGSCAGLLHIAAPAADIGVPAAGEFAAFDVEVHGHFVTWLELNAVGILAEACECHFAGKVAFGVFEHIFFLFPAVAGFGYTRYFGHGVDDGAFDFH